MTLRTWEVLAWLSCDGEVSQAELAECLGIEPHTLAVVLKRMEREGWIERSEHEEDRRRKRLTATPQAEAAWDQSIEICRQVRAQATAGISPAELTALKRVCETIRENLASLGFDSVEPCLQTTNADEASSHRSLQRERSLISQLVASMPEQDDDLFPEEPTV